MEKKELNKLTDEELKQRAANLQGINWTLAVVLLILFCLTLYNTITDGKPQVLMAVPFALSPVLLLNVKISRQIKTKLDNRAK